MSYVVVVVIVARITTKTSNQRSNRESSHRAEDPPVKAKCTPDEKNESIICLMIANCKSHNPIKENRSQISQFQVCLRFGERQSEPIEDPMKVQITLQDPHFSAPRSLI